MAVNASGYQDSNPLVIYHPGMNRPAVVLSAVLTLSLGGVAGAISAHAEPAPPGTLCAFTLSPPQVEGDMVTATVTPTGCAGAFRPRLSVVCVQPADSPPQCSQGRESDTAQVRVPYQPGASYTSTGRGLGVLFNDASEPNWQLLGPFTSVL
jgi:hypothetical protein